MTMGDELPVTSLVLPVLIRPVLTQLEKYDLGASQTLRAALTKAESAVPGLNYDLVAGIMRRADIPVNMNESLLRLQGTLTDTECADLRLTRSEEAFQELNKKSTALKKILSRIPDEITDRKTFLETIKMFLMGSIFHANTAQRMLLNNVGEIASAIKKLLDAVNEVSTYTPGPGKQVLEQRKREFVKYSKRFSNTLKEYFKEGHRKTSTAEHRPPSRISNMKNLNRLHPLVPSNLHQVMCLPCADIIISAQGRHMKRANAVFVSALYLIYQTNQILYTVKSKSE